MRYAPDAEFQATTSSIPDMVKYGVWASGTWGLSNTGGDEVLLLDRADTVLDVLVYGSGTYAGIPSIALPLPQELFRRQSDSQDTDHCNLDFGRAGLLATSLQISAVAMAPGASLAWTEVGCDYVVESCSNLLEGAWQPAAGAAWPAGQNAWTSAVPLSADASFYRVRGY